MPAASRTATRARTAARRRPVSTAEQHAEWLGLLRPDGPFLTVPVLSEPSPTASTPSLTTSETEYGAPGPGSPPPGDLPLRPRLPATVGLVGNGVASRDVPG
jgi:hypothetical protein